MGSVRPNSTPKVRKPLISAYGWTWVLGALISGAIHVAMVLV